MSFILPTIGGGFIAHQSAGASFDNTKSVDFIDGTNTEMTCGDIDALDSATAFPLSCWVFFTASELIPKTCFFSSGDNTQNNLIRFHKGSNDELKLQVKTSGSGADLSAGTGTVLTANTWHHIAATYSSGTGKMYLDGSLLSTGTTGSAPSVAGDDMHIGRLAAGFNAHYMKGLMDEVAIWDATLSDADITSIYNSGLPNDLSVAGSYDTDRTSNLVHWWRMGDGDTSPTVIDHGVEKGGGGASTLRDGTLNNGATFSMNHAGFNRFSLSFDGSNDSLEGSANSSINFSGNLSVSAWVRQDTLAHGGIVAVGESSTDGSAFPGMFHVHTSPTKLQFYDSTGSIQKTALTPTVNEWVHILVSIQSGVSGGSVIYINGSVDQSSFTKTITAATGTVKVFIGRKSYNTNHVNGFIDEVAIFNSALSATDASNIYNSGVPIDLGTNGLNLNPVGWWRMGDNDAGTGTTITDQGSGGNDVSFVNTPTFSSTIPPQA